MRSDKKKIAIIGGGISGLSAAYYLSKLDAFEISLFEQDSRLGGHAHTAVHNGIPFDTTVVAYHVEAYPRFHSLVQELGLESETRVFRQDLCFHQPKGVDYLVSYNPLNALLRPHLLMKTAMVFKKFSRALVAHQRKAASGNTPVSNSMSFGEYLHTIPMKENEIKLLMVPLMHMFFGVDLATTMAMPADFVVRHLYEHKIFHHSTLHACRSWNKGTATYINRLAQVIRGRIHTGINVQQVSRTPEGKVCIKIAGSEGMIFDSVLIATPPAAAYRILAKPTSLEKRILSPWQSSRFKRIIHQDVSVLPKSPAARGFWNPYSVPDQNLCGASYVIKKIQPDVASDLVVSWDPIQDIDTNKILEESYANGIPYTASAYAQHADLPLLNEQNHGIYFCGAYFKFGWHESGVQSALDAIALIQRDFLNTASEVSKRA